MVETLDISNLDYLIYDLDSEMCFKTIFQGSHRINKNFKLTAAL